MSRCDPIKPWENSWTSQSTLSQYIYGKQLHVFAFLCVYVCVCVFIEALEKQAFWNVLENIKQKHDFQTLKCKDEKCIIACNPGVNWEIKVPIESESMDPRAEIMKDDLIRRHSFNKSVSNLLILRGKDVQDTDTGFFKSSKL